MNKIKKDGAFPFSPRSFTQWLGIVTSIVIMNILMDLAGGKALDLE